MFKYVLSMLLIYSVACHAEDILKAPCPQDALLFMELSSVPEAIASLKRTLESNLESDKDNWSNAWLLSLAHRRLFEDNFEIFLKENQTILRQEDLEYMHNPVKMKLLDQAMKTTNVWERGFTLITISSVRYNPSDKKEKNHIIQAFKWLIVTALLNYNVQDKSSEVLFSIIPFHCIDLGILQKGMLEAKAWLKAHGKYDLVQKEGNSLSSCLLF
ncbi:MAG: hypothetical protein WD055_01770 [Candidatus Dependentiae bacterium]